LQQEQHRKKCELADLERAQRELELSHRQQSLNQERTIAESEAEIQVLRAKAIDNEVEMDGTGQQLLEPTA
jgi:hypothetical protein